MSVSLSVQREYAASIQRDYEAALEWLAQERAIERLRDRDATFWKKDPKHEAVIKNRLGWLDAPAWLGNVIPELTSFAAEIRGAGFTRVLLLGMGGSSLAPEVFARICTPGPGAPTLDVLDSTDPAAIVDAEAFGRLDRTFFLVSSKSGKTIETLSQYHYFRDRVERLGLADAGHRFAAVTDGGSALDQLATSDGFRRIFRNPPDIGGRYSALTYFGMVPAALLGLDLNGIQARARATEEECWSDPQASRAVRLAALLGAAAQAGRDKMTLLTTPTLRPLGFWIEQLVAESTGKEGTGIIPVEGEPLGPAHHYGTDRIFVSFSLHGEPNGDLTRLEGEMVREGAPWIQIELPHRDAIADEFYCWEVATALVGAMLEIDPFDEPNVQESKDNTEALLTTLERTGSLPTDEPRTRGDGVEIHAPDNAWAKLQAGAPSMPSLEMVLHRFLGLAEPGDYLSLLAYFEKTAATEAAFALLRRAIRNAIHIPVLQGYGPRYLHSIGQLYKGGPPRGLFLEMTTVDPGDLQIPGRSLTFGQLKAAQALGDFAAITKRGRPALRLHLTHGPDAGLRAITHAVERALAAMQSA